MQPVITFHHPVALFRTFALIYLLLVPITDFDFQNAVIRLRPTKCVRVDNTLGFIIKGCSTVLVPVLKNIFNLGVSQQHFQSQWKQSVTLLV